VIVARPEKKLFEPSPRPSQPNKKNGGDLEVGVRGWDTRLTACNPPVMTMADGEEEFPLRRTSHTLRGLSMPTGRVRKFHTNETRDNKVPGVPASDIAYGYLYLHF
jgi:hypothetical protein